MPRLGTDGRSTPPAGSPLLDGLDPESRVLLACCRVQPEPRQLAAVKDRVEQGLDWSRLLAEADRHRVTPSLYRGLRAAVPNAVPPAVMDQLEASCHACARHGLLLAGELIELIELLAQHDIPVLPYKGPALAAALYGDVARRQFDDLDVLVRREHLRPAAVLLAERGFEPVGWGLEDPGLGKRGHNLELRRGEVKLELHWRISFFSPLDTEGLWRRSQTMLLLGREVRCFDDRDLLMILSVHGGKHLWQRLQWVTDVAELCRRHAQDWDWSAVLLEARRLGGERMVALGLRLASHLLDAELPPSLADRLRARSSLDALEQRACRSLFAPEAAGPFDHYRFYFGMRERLRDRLRYGVHLARGKLAPTERDRRWLPLPRALSFLHYATRPLRLLVDHGGAVLPAARARRLLRRALALSPREALLVARVAALVVVLPALQKLLSLPRLVRWLDSDRQLPRPGAEAEMARAIRLTQGLLGIDVGVFRPNCMKQSLVLFRQLRRLGLPVSIHFGAQLTDGKLSGHSWLELDGRPLAEKADPYDFFSVVYSYPDGSYPDGSYPEGGQRS